MLILAPRVGPLLAVLIEAPIMLVASWVMCRASARRFDVPANPRSRVVMGTLAFGALQLLEITLAVALLRRSPDQFFADLGTPAGVLGLAAQLTFATFPLVQARSAAQPGRDPLQGK